MSCPIWLGESEFPEGRAGELSIATAEGLWEGWLPQRSCRVWYTRWLLGGTTKMALCKSLLAEPGKSLMALPASEREGCVSLREAE